MRFHGLFKSVLATTLAVGLAATSANAATVYNLSFDDSLGAGDGILVANSGGALPVPGSTSGFTGTLDLSSVDLGFGGATATSDVLVNGASTNANTPIFVNLSGQLIIAGGVATGGSLTVTDGANEVYSASITGGSLTDDGTNITFDGTTLGSFSSSTFTGQTVTPAPAQLRGLVLVFRFNQADPVGEMTILVSDPGPGGGVVVPLPASLWAGLLLLSGCGAARIVRRKVA